MSNSAGKARGKKDRSQCTGFLCIALILAAIAPQEKQPVTQNLQNQRMIHRAAQTTVHNVFTSYKSSIKNGLSRSVDYRLDIAAAQT
jgi:hypothetical protein